MLYNLLQPYDKAKFDQRANTLSQRGAMVELTDRSKKTYSQNRYLHLLLDYYAVCMDVSPETVKRELYKRIINPDIFVLESKVEWAKDDLKSTKSITKEEMTLSITRFRNTVALPEYGGIVTPDAKNKQQMFWMEQEIERMSEFARF